MVLIIIFYFLCSVFSNHVFIDVEVNNVLTEIGNNGALLTFPSLSRGHYTTSLDSNENNILSFKIQSDNGIFL